MLEVKQLFYKGLGIHHAGMLRSDRLLSEKLFSMGLIKVLCCTATLAWGVNLPAHTVIIKGTEMYDPERGGYVNISILDVLQIFGRAGRPQFDSSGHAIMLTTQGSLSNYMSMLTQQAPIESNLIQHLADHLNAEIVNGTVNNVKEASQWLSYTFLFIRMKRNPLVYGIKYEDIYADSQLTSKRQELIQDAAVLLDNNMMVRYDKKSGNLAVCDLGRIASHFYLKYGSISIFNSMLTHPHLLLHELLHVLCSASEFDQLKLRPEEVPELEKLHKLHSRSYNPSDDSYNLSSGSSSSSSGIVVGDVVHKVTVLLQHCLTTSNSSYSNSTRIQSFTLQSDMNYITQNASRITRALLEITLKRGWCSCVKYLLLLANCLDRQVDIQLHPLRQFYQTIQATHTHYQRDSSWAIPNDVLQRLEDKPRSSTSIHQLLDMSDSEVTSLLHTNKHTHKIQWLLQRYPQFDIQTQILPITNTIVRLNIQIRPTFTWDDRIHGQSENYYLLITDAENEYIYYHEYITFSKQHPRYAETHNSDDKTRISVDKSRSSGLKELEVILPVKDPRPKQFFIELLSDHWVNVHTVQEVPFTQVQLSPALSTSAQHTIYTNLLPCHPVPVTALKNSSFEEVYTSRKVEFFNPIQSHLFHTLYHTDKDTLIGAPTGSGKTIMSEIALFKVLRDCLLSSTSTTSTNSNNNNNNSNSYSNNNNSSKVYHNNKVVYIAPLKALAKERLNDWQNKFSPPVSSSNSDRLRLHIVEMTGEHTPSVEELNRANILIVTPEKWDSISRGWKKREYVKQVKLMIIDEIHLLGVDRGPVLEVVVSRMRYIATQLQRTIRIVGLSTALSNARDVADWLGIDNNIYNIQDAISGGPGGSGGTSAEYSKRANTAVGLYNFRASVRPVPMSIHIQGFPGKHYCPRMATMNKPAYSAILEHSPFKPVLIFVSSRRQTRLTALDLIAHCAADVDYDGEVNHGEVNHGLGEVNSTRRFLHMSEEEVASVASTLKDKALRDTIVFGIGIHHAGLDHHDRRVVEELFLNNKIQVLVCTTTLAWGVNLPCHLVIVKGSEYFDADTHGYVDYPLTDILQMIGRAGRPQFDTTATAMLFVSEAKKHFYKKFLFESFPVESSLHHCMHEHINAEVSNHSIHQLLDVLEYLTWTYYYRRLLVNPNYYGCSGGTNDEVVQHLFAQVRRVLADLVQEQCIAVVPHDSSSSSSPPEELSAEDVLQTLTLRTCMQFCLQPRMYGTVSSYYYLHHTTPRRLVSNTHAYTAASGGLDAVHSVCACLRVLCEVKEFGAMPVRHNEEHLNAQLAGDVQTAFSLLTNNAHNNAHNTAVDVNAYMTAYDSPHSKALLLLLSTLLHVSFPISDYTTDLKNLLEQLPRVLNACVDLCAYEGLVASLCGVLRTQQLLAQCVPPLPDHLHARSHCNATELLQVYPVTPTSIQYIQQYIQLLSQHSVHSLQSMIACAHNNTLTAILTDVFDKLNRSVTLFSNVSHAVNAVVQRLSLLPRLAVTCKLCGYPDGQPYPSSNCSAAEEVIFQRALKDTSTATSSSTNRSNNNRSRQSHSHSSTAGDSVVSMSGVAMNFTRTATSEVFNLPVESDVELEVDISLLSGLCKNSLTTNSSSNSSSTSGNSNGSGSGKSMTWWLVLLNAGDVTSQQQQHGSNNDTGSGLDYEKVVAAVSSPGQDLVAFKRIGNLFEHVHHNSNNNNNNNNKRRSTKVKLLFTAPDEVGSFVYQVLLVNDSVLGIDHFLPLRINTY